MTAGEDLEAIGWSSVLASFFSYQGRHDEALVLFESGLNYLLQNPLLCSQPEHVLVSSLIFNVANEYSALGRHEDALAMQEKTLDFQRRVLPENHPDIGAFEPFFSRLVI